MNLHEILHSRKFSQVAVIVSDVEKSKREYAKLFDMEVPPTELLGIDESVETNYRGKIVTNAGCKMAFFWIEDGLQFEIIEPNEAPSAWREFLDKTGGGLHHIAFRIDDMEEALKAAESIGMEMIQRGLYGDKTGEYAYLDATKTLDCYVELLLDYK